MENSYRITQAAQQSLNELDDIREKLKGMIAQKNKIAAEAEMEAQVLMKLDAILEEHRRVVHVDGLR